MRIPQIRAHLLWEYDIATFNFATGAAIVITRVVERGNIQEWQEIIASYGKNKVLETVADSPQLSPRDKAFTAIFIQTNFIEQYAAPL